MKPEGGVQTDMDEIEMDPHQLYLQLGMLVVESRLPDPSPKGRRQGPHCPLVLGEANWHTCDVQAFYCRRARAMQKEMQTLWRNRVPMCIEVTLLPDCYHGIDRATGSDVTLPTEKGGSLLLEQWTIQVLPKRLANNPVSVKALFQAVQSHLYFSQLSAWLNRTHGKSPVSVSYRISPPGDFCTSSFPQVPVCHTFPVAAISKSLSMCVTARCMPRMHDIPHIRCREAHIVDRMSLEGATGVSSTQTVYPGASHISQSGSGRQIDFSSPRFQKPRVITEQPRETVPRYVGRGFRGPDSRLSVTQAEQHTAKSPQGLSSQMRPDVRTTMVVEYDSTMPATRGGTALPAKHTGAIPKRLPHKSPPAVFYESDCSSSAPDSLSPERDSLTPLQTSSTDDPDAKVIGASPKVIMTQQATTQVYYGKDKEKVNWVLKNVVSNNSSTDSDSSSPDIDRYLSRNLTNRLDPLSPAEMENYLEKLCGSGKNRKVHDSRSSGELGYVYNVNNCDLQQSPVLHKGEGNQSKCVQSPVLDKCTGAQSKCSDESNKELSEISASLSALLRRGISYSEQDENDTKSKPKTHKSVSHKPNSACSTKSAKSLSRRQEKSRSLQESGADNKMVTSVTLTETHPEAVKFTLDEDETNDQNEEYSDHCHSNGSTANGDSRLPTKSDSRNNFTNGDSHSNVEKTRSQDYTNGVDSTNGVQTDISSQSDSVPMLPFHKSISCPGSAHNKGFSLPSQRVAVRANNLLKTVMRRELSQNEQFETEEATNKMSTAPVPTDFDRITFQKSLNSSANMIFHAATGLPLQSSPAPTKKRTSGTFEYDASLTNPRAIKNSLSCVNLDSQKDLANQKSDEGKNQRMYSTSAPASTNCLLGNFEESMLNGRLEPSGVVEGFTADIGASGAFCPKHVTLPLTAFFFSLSDDNAPSPYLGHINLESLGKRGYHVPKKGTVQVTMFNPNKTVVKMFVVVYDLCDMPANSQTFLRQRTLYMPIRGSACDTTDAPVYLRYLIHLRFSSSKSGKIYLHTDIRLIFARDKFEFDSRVANYEIRSFTEGPINPKFSPKR